LRETAMLVCVLDPLLLWDPSLSHRAVVGGILTLLFTTAARLLRGVTGSGAVAGAAVSFVLYLGAGAAGFLTLVSVFLLTLLATKVGYAQKQKMGMAERGDGRTASQVVANLGVAAAAALVFLFHAEPVLAILCVAALAEAAADTVSSEIGQAASSTARLITTWKSVSAGTDGGITPLGTLAGILAALAVCLVAFWVKFIPFPSVGIALAAAVLGMLFDSLLGAWLERRSVLNNDHVNFLGTLTAAVLAAVAGTLAR
jgi:uncharacterized protein (TIGR00297 family)